MNSPARPPADDPLYALPAAARPHYATGMLLGDLPTFRSLFCAGDDRRLREGQDDELRRRVASVCQRTLRRQAQAFMTRPFVERRARVFEYTMGPQEKAL